MARNLRVASQLWASATVFFFFAFLFAYFYLRSLNSQRAVAAEARRPRRSTLGTLIDARVVLAAALLRLAVRRPPRRRPPRLAREGRGRARPRLVAAVVLQIVEWATQGFGPTEGGYASVFLGWTGLYALFVLGLAVLARDDCSRRRSATAAGAAGACGRARQRATRIAIATTSSTRSRWCGRSSTAFAFYATVLAGIGVVTWLILYLL